MIIHHIKSINADESREGIIKIEYKQAHRHFPVTMKTTFRLLSITVVSLWLLTLFRGRNVAERIVHKQQQHSIRLANSWTNRLEDDDEPSQGVAKAMHAAVNSSSMHPTSNKKVDIIVIYTTQLSSPGTYNDSGTTTTTSTNHNSSAATSTTSIQDVCSDRSLDSIALEMIHYSSQALNKTKYVLSRSEYFNIDLSSPIFRSVESNLIAMLEGYGLHHSLLSKDDAVTIESSFKGLKDHNFTKPRIVIQTEQLLFQRPLFGQYLRNCFASPQCVVWDFSDSNYNIAQRWDHPNFKTSMLLLPTMTQNRLDLPRPPAPSRQGGGQQGVNDGSFSSAGEEDLLLLVTPPPPPQMIEQLKPIRERQYDVVFFGRMTPRRIAMKDAFLQQQQQQQWNTLFETNNNKERISHAYGDAKICLTMHADTNTSGGEYHRLTDFARKGCIPLMEEWDDAIGIDAYTATTTTTTTTSRSKCGGGVVFARHDDLIVTAARLLERINNSTEVEERMMLDRVKWWRKDIEWPTLLTRAFSGS
jgi:hypothetical protein